MKEEKKVTEEKTYVCVEEVIRMINNYTLSSEYPIDYNALLTAFAKMKIEED